MPFGVENNADGRGIITASKGTLTIKNCDLNAKYVIYTSNTEGGKVVINNSTAAAGWSVLAIAGSNQSFDIDHSELESTNYLNGDDNLYAMFKFSNNNENTGKNNKVVVKNSGIKIKATGTAMQTLAGSYFGPLDSKDAEATNLVEIGSGNILTFEGTGTGSYGSTPIDDIQYNDTPVKITAIGVIANKSIDAKYLDNGLVWSHNGESYVSAKSVTVSFDPNGGKFSDGSNETKTVTKLSCDYINSDDWPNGLTKDGCSFAGWYGKDDYGEDQEYTAETLIDSDITLTAKWTAIPAPTPKPDPVKDVVDAINALPANPATDAEKAQVAAARAAYEALDAAAKQLITESELSKLENAEYYWASTDAKAQKVTLKSVKAKKGQKALAKWKKNEAASGYQLVYSTSKKFTKKTTKKVTDRKSVV